MHAAFYDREDFDEDISCWDTSKVVTFTEDQRGMFEEAKSFNQPIGCWDVGSATTMMYMFYRALDFNQDVSNWNVAKVTDMKYMFVGATSFNQNLSKWDAPNLAEDGGCGFANGAPCGPTCGFSGYKADSDEDCDFMML